MNTNDKSRKKFLLWASTILGGLMIFRFVGKQKKSDTVKMLTRDGKLVSIDRNLLSGKRTKIEQKELQSWVQKNNR